MILVWGIFYCGLTWSLVSELQDAAALYYLLVEICRGKDGPREGFGFELLFWLYAAVNLFTILNSGPAI